MLELEKSFAAVSSQLGKLKAEYDETAGRLASQSNLDEASRLRRMENLRVQLKKIEEYSEKVEYFKNLAEKHIDHKNLPTIAPVELDFNKLRNWAMSMDPEQGPNNGEESDPYALRIYAQTMGNKMLLEKKKEEFETTLAELENRDGRADRELEASVKKARETLSEKERLFLEGEEFREFTYLLKAAHRGNSETDTDSSARSGIGIGLSAKELPVFEELRGMVKVLLGDYYDDNGGWVLMPVAYPEDRECVIAAECVKAKEKKLYGGIQSYILRRIRNSPLGGTRVIVLDPMHYNSTVLGKLRAIEGTDVIDSVPTDSEELEDALKLLVSELPEIDEKLELADSVAEYNAVSPAEKRIERKILVLPGYPSAFSMDARRNIRRILMNFEHYGITVITADDRFRKKEDREEDFPDIVENFFRVRMTQHKDTASIDGGSEGYFKWYYSDGELPEEFITVVKKFRKNSGRGNEYPKRVDMERLPAYTRGNRVVRVPYAVDSNDKEAYISFDNENFAAFLMGSSGSGKSTLLHNIITGVIGNYHPDDVELWLADFKMSEFAQYMDPMPPHVKYILLDESRELVFDLIDKLTEILMERQKVFMRQNWKNIEKVDNDVYMPVIFVILDEFSIMSQAISESDTYKLKLQNLLAKGRAMGIRFLFSSQTFTKGVSGLTATAKDQIQSRIAMKNSGDEITQTLELSSAMKTDKVKGWIDALPPHYALYKFRENDRINLEKLHVMYFPGNDEEAYEPQRRLIKRISEMKPVTREGFNGRDINTYVDKHPVTVNGNAFDAWNPNAFLAAADRMRADNPGEYTADEWFISLGTPRLLEKAKLSAVYQETRENMLLVARAREAACAASVLMTLMNEAGLQGLNVRIWAYGKNPLFKKFRKVFEETGASVAEGIDSVCDEIRTLKSDIACGKQGRDLIVLIGMERICMDFELAYGAASASAESSFEEEYNKMAQTAGANTKEELDEALYYQELLSYFDAHIDEEKAQSMTEEERYQLEDELEKQFRLEKGLDQEAAGQEKHEAEPEKPEEKAPEASETGAYNALNDFAFIVKQGSRLGYHFAMTVNMPSDLKQCGLKTDLFRYKMAFQTSSDDSSELFGSKVAAGLPEHICQISDSYESYSFRPLIHEGIGWEGWYIDESGALINPFEALD